MWRPQTKEAVLREVRIREWRVRVWKRTKIVFAWCFRQLIKGTAIALRWLMAKSSATASEVELNRLLSQRYDKLMRLGERAYGLYQTGNFSWQALEPFFSEIAEIDKQLEKARSNRLDVIAEEPNQQIRVTGS